MRSADAEVFAALGRAFGALGARWYVFGAQAAILYGAVRLTEDVDATVDPGGHSTADIVEALAREGIALRVPDADGFVERTRVLPLVHGPTDVPVDVVLSGPGLEELFFERVRFEEIEGVKVPVASPEDVVTMKILAARPKDIEDALAILTAAGERALDQSDLVPCLHELRGRADRRG
jgi:hypothetical protein